MRNRIRIRKRETLVEWELFLFFSLCVHMCIRERACFRWDNGLARVLQCHRSDSPFRGFVTSCWNGRYVCTIVRAFIFSIASATPNRSTFISFLFHVLMNICVYRMGIYLVTVNYHNELMKLFLLIFSFINYFKNSNSVSAAWIFFPNILLSLSIEFIFKLFPLS